MIVVGDPAVGKTALLHRLKTNQYACENASTIGVVSGKFEMLLQEEFHVKLQLWDTAGQEKFRSITRLFYKDSDAIIICFSLASRESFVHLPEWLKEIEEHRDSAKMVKYLVGNCADLKEDVHGTEDVYSNNSDETEIGRSVTREEALEFVRE